MYILYQLSIDLDQTPPPKGGLRQEIYQECNPLPHMVLKVGSYGKFKCNQAQEDSYSKYENP